MHTKLVSWFAAVVWFVMLHPAQAQTTRPNPVHAQVLGVTGDVRFQRFHDDVAGAIQPEQSLSAGTQVIVAPGGFVSLRLPDGSVVRLYPNTKVLLESLTPGRDAKTQSKPTVLVLDKGSLDAEVTRKRTPVRRFEVRSELAVAGVRGTSFSVTVGDDRRFVGHVWEGVVAVRSLATRASVELRAGRGVTIDPNLGLGALFALLPTVPDIPIAALQVDEAAFLQVRYSAVSGASGYQFQVARDEAMTQVLRNGFFEKPHAVFSGLPAGKYFISVRAVDANGARGAEGIQALVIQPRALAPVLVIPKPGEVGEGQDADVYCGAIAGSRSYRIQVAGDADFKTKLLDAPAQSVCRITGLTDLTGLFFWRVAAEIAPDKARGGLVQDAPLLGAWSQIVPIRLVQGRLKELRPFAGVGQSDAGGLFLRYQVQVSASPVFDTTVLDHFSTNTNLPLDLPDGRYYVRWKVVLPGNAESEFSAPQVVTLQR